MDPGHYIAYLLAIALCILLLFLAASALLVCFLRRYGFITTNRKSSMRLGAAMRNQSTSMSSFDLNFMDPKHPIFGDLDDPQGMYLPMTVDRSKQPTSLLSPDSHVLCVSEDEEGTPISGLDSKSARKKSNGSGQYSAFKYMLSSGASVLGSVWERSSTFSLKAKRRSSSLKSGVDADITMAPLESPVHDSSLASGTLPVLSRSSTVLCENSTDQQFTWDSTNLSIRSDLLTDKETSSSPSTTEHKPDIPKEGSIKTEMVQLQNPDFLQPTAWFVHVRNRPGSDGVQLEKKELNNVPSLDSGVDTADMILRSGSGGSNTMPKVLATCRSENNGPLSNLKEQPKASYNRGEMQEVEETQEDCQKLYRTHQEAARKLNPGYSGRSLWEKREERPLMVN